MGYLLAEMQHIARSHPGATVVSPAADRGRRAAGRRAAARRHRPARGDRRGARPRGPGHHHRGPRHPARRRGRRGDRHRAGRDHADLLRLPGHGRDRRAGSSTSPRRGGWTATVQTQLTPGLDHRLDVGGRPRQAARLRHRPARRSAGRGGARPGARRADRPARRPARCAAPPTPRRSRGSARPRARPCAAATTAASPSTSSRRSDGDPAHARPPRARTGPRFHALTVAGGRAAHRRRRRGVVRRPAGAGRRVRFEPGQHLTLRATIDGEDTRRSYSICRSPQEARRLGELRVAAARVDGGLMSTWLNDSVARRRRGAGDDPAGVVRLPDRPRPRPGTTSRSPRARASRR